jgi:hypothetical protein
VIAQDALELFVRSHASSSPARLAQRADSSTSEFHRPRVYSKFLVLARNKHPPAPVHDGKARAKRPTLVVAKTKWTTPSGVPHWGRDVPSFRRQAEMASSAMMRK